MQGCHIADVTPCSQVFITHGHLDHCGAVHLHAAQRSAYQAAPQHPHDLTNRPLTCAIMCTPGMKGLPPPSVYLPPCNVDGMRAALQVRISQPRTPR